MKNRGDATPPYVEVKGSTFPKIHSFEIIMALRTLYVKDFFCCQTNLALYTLREVMSRDKQQHS